MKSELENSKQAGMFSISDGREIYGELTLAGGDTSLYLRDKDFFDTDEIPDKCLKGTLHDLTKVTLINCITTTGFGSSTRNGETYRFATMFPHFVVHGDSHISPRDATISSVDFVVDDASTLFYDFDAFGVLIDARPFIEQIVHAKKHGREVKTGPSPEILYFTGKEEIFSVETIFGRVSASHRPVHSMGGPDGVFLRNTIPVSVDFNESVAFDEAIARVVTLLKFFEVLVGRTQNLLQLYLHLTSQDERPIILQVYWSNPPKREFSNEEKRPQPRDVLLDAVRQPKAFSSVLKSWLERQKSWRDARFRFSGLFANHYSYTIDRLIGSANIFDILPAQAVPSDVQLSEELQYAKDVSITAFKKLPPTAERDSVLSALGRLGKSVLKHKIRYRARLIIEIMGDIFPDLTLVADEAVNCRNHYVHGSSPRFDYNGNFEAVIFFTNTLEFIFATSDLIDAGWDIASWCKTGTTMSHPFGAYRVTYAENLQNLRELLDKSTEDNSR